MSIVFVGGGNMASALIGGLLAHGQPVNQIGVVEIDASAGAKLQSDWGVRSTHKPPLRWRMPAPWY